MDLGRKEFTNERVDASIGMKVTVAIMIDLATLQTKINEQWWIFWRK